MKSWCLKATLFFQFMREFAAVWKWTVEEKKGVFTPVAEAAGRTGVKPQSVPVKQHMLLIKVGESAV